MEEFYRPNLSETRPLQLLGVFINFINSTIKRLTTDSYWSTDGLGFLEYLILCEDLNAIPIWVAHIFVVLFYHLFFFLILYYTLEYSLVILLFLLMQLSPGFKMLWIVLNMPTETLPLTGEPNELLMVIPIPSVCFSLLPLSLLYIGSNFHLLDIEIMALGNENGCGFDSKHIYVQYYEAFATRILSQYPNIKLIANCDISSSTKYIDYFDVHLYESPQWFVDNANMFDSYSRSGPKAFVSEYLLLFFLSFFFTKVNEFLR